MVFGTMMKEMMMPSRIDLKIFTNQITERLFEIEALNGIQHVTSSLIDCIDDRDVRSIIEYFQEFWDTEIEPPDETEEEIEDAE